MTILFILNNAINWIINPLIGRAINAFGERLLCTIEYAGLVAVFLTYAFAASKVTVAVMYILNHLLFNLPSPFAPISRRCRSS